MNIWQFTLGYLALLCAGPVVLATVHGRTSFESLGHQDEVPGSFQGKSKLRSLLQKPETTKDLLNKYFSASEGECPVLTATPIGAGTAKGFYPIKDIAKSFYKKRENQKHANNKAITHIFMWYKALKPGDTYCWSPKSPVPKIAMGGTVMFRKNGKCFFPPTKADGSSCCTMKIWQPDDEGYYYNDCSSSFKLDATGLWWMYTLMPFDESERWGGPDDKPHVHYDVRCSECQNGIFKGSLETSMGEGWWNKWYPEDRCTRPGRFGCGKTGPQHEALQGTLRKIPTYRYHTIIPLDDVLSPMDKASKDDIAFYTS